MNEADFEGLTEIEIIIFKMMLQELEAHDL